MNYAQLINEPTRERNILDLSFTTDQKCINSHEVYNPHISDHFLISCTVRYENPKPIVKTISFRAFESMDLPHFAKEVCELTFGHDINDIDTHHFQRNY